MSQTQQKQSSVLYVDDEAEALKYFKRGLGKQFPIITAGSAAEAWEMIADRSQAIGVVVSDQRMPGEKGVDLLGRLKRDRPNVVRILTTAYADLESAIDSVNTGEIYRYVVKPWKFDELRPLLRNALELYELRAERDALVNEKMSVMQRLIVSDRVHSLAVLAAGLSGGLRNARAAVNSFIAMVPDSVRTTILQNEQSQAGDYRLDTEDAMAAESRRIQHLLDGVAWEVASVCENEPTDADLSAIVGGMSAEAPSVPGGIVIRRAQPALLTLGLSRAAEAIASVSNSPVQVSLDADAQVNATEGVRARIHAPGSEWSPDVQARLFALLYGGDRDATAASRALLQACFSAWHHNGSLALSDGSEDVGVDIALPLNPDAAELQTPSTSALEHLYTHFGRWDALRRPGGR